MKRDQLFATAALVLGPPPSMDRVAVRIEGRPGQRKVVYEAPVDVIEYRTKLFRLALDAQTITNPFSANDIEIFMLQYVDWYARQTGDKNALPPA